MGSRACTASSTTARAASWSCVRSASAGRAPRLDTGRSASGRRGRSRTSARTSPRRTSPARADEPWRSAITAAGTPSAEPSEAAASAASSASASTWRGPSGRPRGFDPLPSCAAAAPPGVSHRRRSNRGPAVVPSRVHARSTTPASARERSRRRSAPRPSGDARSRAARDRPARSSRSARSAGASAGAARPSCASPAGVTSTMSSSRSRRPGGSIARTTPATGARYRAAICCAKPSASGGSSGPSVRTRAAIGRAWRPLGMSSSRGLVAPVGRAEAAPVAAAGPRTIPIACRLPNGTRTASPGSRSARSGGTRYVQVRGPGPPGASTATSTRRGAPSCAVGSNGSTGCPPAT